MTTVNTVLGPVEAASLGRTLFHEHLVFGYAGHEGDRSMWDYDEDAIVAKGVASLRSIKEQGFSTIFEATPNDSGRDPLLMKRIAEETGFNVICATGYYKEHHGGSAYFDMRRIFTDTVAEMADLFIKELTEGIRDTGVKAGVMKVATGHSGITDYEHAVISAAARAQQATGAPIITHTEDGTAAPEQARALIDAGADPSKVVVGHMCGNAKNLDYQLAVLETGVGIGFDRTGGNRLFNDITDDDRIDMAVTLAERGYLNRIFWSQDSIANWLGRSWDGFYALPGAKDWKITRIGDYIVPGLLGRGLTEADIDQLLVNNIRSLWEGDI
ncbi:phosphotriesterase family protein [Demequina salsinemoris]|uniref:phosphotriesterase family protein n=1 Tax=Demequina salsinemoris TaxID=577470 RepID=UPI000785D7D9|nr:hypothetical protein [Demequina salsinemoris]